MAVLARLKGPDHTVSWHINWQQSSIGIAAMGVVVTDFPECTWRYSGSFGAL